MIENRLDNSMTAYRVEVETTNGGTTTQTLNDIYYLDCQYGQLVVVTNDPAMIMRTFRVVKLEKIGPGYVLAKEQV